jgi:hypothetical protein
MSPARLLELIDAHLDNNLDDSGRADLQAELTASPVACRLFWERAQQHALLAELLAEAPFGARFAQNRLRGAADRVHQREHGNEVLAGAGQGGCS